jgi:putative PIN family toxin of toxin-antitoxin system
VRPVADTNVLLSGLFWRGRPHALLEQVRAGTLTLISSPALLAELAEVMNRLKFQVILARSDTDPEQTLGELRRLTEIIDPPPLPTPVSRDPSDDEVLALVAGRRAEVHDRRLCLRLPHGTGESLAHVERAFEVDRQHLPQNVGIGIQNAADSPDAGAVDQPTEFSEPSNRSGHEHGHLIPARNVDADAIDPSAAPEFGHDLIELFFPHVCGGDRRALCEQPPDASRADTAAGAGYQDSLVFKALHSNTPYVGLPWDNLLRARNEPN